MLIRLQFPSYVWPKEIEMKPVKKSTHLRVAHWRAQPHQDPCLKMRFECHLGVGLGISVLDHGFYEYTGVRVTAYKKNYLKATSFVY